MIELTLTGILLCCVSILFLLLKLMIRLFLSAILDYDCDITGMDQFIFIVVMVLSLVPILNFIVAYKVFRYTMRMKVINSKLWRRC